jgi:hypothetical protein
MVIALVVAGVVVLAGVGVAVWLTVGRAGSNTVASVLSSSFPTTSRSTAGGGPTGGASAQPSPNTGGATGHAVPPATRQPTGLGNDPLENEYAQECYQGDMTSCDALYLIADDGSAYSKYADSCAGRQPEGTDQLCSDSFAD